MTRRWTFAGAALAFVIATPTLIGCVDANTPAVAPEYAHVAKIHRARCGTCHTRVDPGQRTRADLEPALARHRVRVHLSEDDWNLMVDYLAADKPTQ